MATTSEQIVALASQLSPEKQQQALEFIQELVDRRSLESTLPPGGTASALRNLHFSMSKEEIDSMERAIMEDHEQSINDDETCGHGKL